jgi:spore coat polysaccharide biosynthesis protein SpsF
MKIGVLITARLKSTRLRKKVLRSLGGRPMISHLIDRMRNVHLANSVAVITSTVPQDDELVEFAVDYGVDCYRGDPVDVLYRMACAARENCLDWVVSVTADNPWVAPEWTDRLILHAIKHDLDFAKVQGLPFGAFSYVLKTSAIYRACELKVSKDTEVWGSCFEDKYGFEVGVLNVPRNNAVYRPNYRLTVDTPEDFNLAKEIVESLPPHDQKCPRSLYEITSLIDQSPALLNLNKDVIQAPAEIIEMKYGKF